MIEVRSDQQNLGIGELMLDCLLSDINMLDCQYLSFCFHSQNEAVKGLI